jgi:ubiquitin-protein ligase
MSKNDDSNTIVITKETVKRLSKDIKELIKSPLHDEGIYYKHDETDILKGYAYISGPQGSLYVGGNYFFTFKFPYDYPHKPPKVEFNTTDGYTRFHPNLYRTGKICLSILNTWKGEQWTGCQSIRTILLTILSILDDKPLLHEPGYTETHKDFNKYNEIILFKNIEFSINKLMSREFVVSSTSTFIELFRSEMNDQFKQKYDNILQILEEKKDDQISTVHTNIYNLNIIINWKDEYEIFKKIDVN